MTFDYNQQKYQDMKIEDKIEIICETPLQPIREREELAKRLARRRALNDDNIRKRIYDLFAKLKIDRFESETRILFNGLFGGFDKALTAST